MIRAPSVYIMASQRNGTIYTGVTSDLGKRVWQHRTAGIPGFTSEHGCKLLVWFEQHASMEQAILREKSIKAGSRARKVALIEGDNPQWLDLYDRIV